MTSDYESVDKVYARAYDNAYFMGYNGEYGPKAAIAAGVHAVADWSRREALAKAANISETLMVGNRHASWDTIADTIRNEL